MENLFFDSKGKLKESSLYLSLALFAFSIIIYRAIYIPLFVDEIVTYTHYVKNEYFSPYNELKKANNHLVNTLLTYVSYSLFGNSPFSFRFFNVLAFIPYGFFVYKIGLLFQHKFVKWAFYLASLFTLNLLVYFSLCRGYGLSFAFMMASIYYLMQVSKRTNIWDIPLTVIPLVLALYSNFSLLLYVFITGLILLINVLKKSRFYFQNFNLIVILLSVIGYVVSIVYAIKILFYYKDQGVLWWGDLSGFWVTTVRTLIHNLFNTWDHSYVIQTLIGIATLFIVVMYILNHRFSYKNIYTYFFTLNVVGVVLMGLLFEINYPYQRTGIHLYVFFIGAFCFSADRIASKNISLFSVSLLFLIPIHFALFINLNQVVDWEEDNVPNDFFEKIKEIEAKENREYIPSIHIHGTAKVAWNYINNTNYEPYMPICPEGVDKENIYNDYVVFRKEEFLDSLHLYDSIASQSTSSLVLYKRKTPAKRKLLVENIRNEKVTVSEEYHEFIRYRIDSNKTTALNMELIAALDYHKQPFRTDLVVAVENPTTRETISRKVVNLFTKEDWKKEDPLVFGCFIDGLPLGEEFDVMVYLWNINKVTYTINESEVRINKVTNPALNTTNPILKNSQKK